MISAASPRAAKQVIMRRSTKRNAQASSPSTANAKAALSPAMSNVSNAAIFTLTSAARRERGLRRTIRERYHQGERVRALLLRVDEGVRGTYIRLSRSS